MAGWEDQSNWRGFFFPFSSFVGAEGRENTGSMTRADSRAMYLCMYKYKYISGVVGAVVSMYCIANLDEVYLRRIL